MGVRSASRQRTVSSPLWDVSYHLPQSGNAALASPEPHTAPMPLQDDPAVLQERRRLQRRRDLVGRNVRLPREWADVLNPESPVALQPRFDWLGWAGKSRFHDEMRWTRWATVLDSGEVLKAYSEEGLEKLRSTVLRVKPVMEHFGLVVPVFYQNHGRVYVGGCSFEEEFDGITVPQVICLSTRVEDPTELTYSILHELGHIGETAPATAKKRHQTRYDYQRSLHSDAFRRHHAELLLWHLEHQASPEEAKKLRRWADEDSYAPPIPPDGKSWA